MFLNPGVTRRGKRARLGEASQDASVLKGNWRCVAYIRIKFLELRLPQMYCLFAIRAPSGRAVVKRRLASK